MQWTIVFETCIRNISIDLTPKVNDIISMYPYVTLYNRLYNLERIYNRAGPNFCITIWVPPTENEVSHFCFDHHEYGLLYYPKSPCILQPVPHEGNRRNEAGRRNNRCNRARSNTVREKLCNATSCGKCMTTFIYNDRMQKYCTLLLTMRNCCKRRLFSHF